MRISDIINEDNIEIGAELCSKNEALARVAALQYDGEPSEQATKLLCDILRREAAANSAVSCRIAIPVISDSKADKIRISALTLRNGIEYGAPDIRNVKLIFLITGKDYSGDCLYAKTRLMRLLMDSGFSARLCSASGAEEFLKLIKEREDFRFSRDSYKESYDCSRFIIRPKAKERKHHLLLSKLKGALKHHKHKH